MVEILAKFIVLLASIFLIFLAAASFTFPKLAARFLDGFAKTASVHFTEMVIRLAVGFALVLASQDMALSVLYYFLGWVLVVTSVVLMLLPWQYHKKFASIVVPPLARHVWLFGPLALPLGVAMVLSLILGLA